MKKNILFGILGLFSGFSLLGQQLLTTNLQSTRGDWDKSRFVSLVNEIDKAIRDGKGNKVELSDVEGSMYDVREFRNGQVYLGNELHSNFPMRYNAYSDEFEVKEDVGDEILGLARSNYLTFVLDGAQFVYLDYLDKDGELAQGHLQVLANNGKYRLYKRKVKLFKEGKKAETSFHKDVPHKFIDSESFYIQVGDKYPMYLKNSKKVLKEFFDEKDMDKVKSYIKKNGTKLNDENDLVRLFNNLQL